MDKWEGCHRFEPNERRENHAFEALNLMGGHHGADIRFQIRGAIVEPQVRINFGAPIHHEPHLIPQCILPPLAIEVRPDFYEPSPNFMGWRSDYYNSFPVIPNGYWEPNGPIVYQSPYFEAPPVMVPRPLPPADYAPAVPAEPNADATRDGVSASNSGADAGAGAGADAGAGDSKAPAGGDVPSTQPTPTPSEQSTTNAEKPEVRSSDDGVQPGAVSGADAAKLDAPRASDNTGALSPSTQPADTAIGVSAPATPPSTSEQAAAPESKGPATQPIGKTAIEWPLAEVQAPSSTPLALQADPAPDASVMADDIVRLARNIKSNGAKDTSHFNEKAILQDLQLMERQDASYQNAVKQIVENAGAWYNRTPYMTVNTADHGSGASLVIKVNADAKFEKITADVADPISKW